MPEILTKVIDVMSRLASKHHNEDNEVCSSMIIDHCFRLKIISVVTLGKLGLYFVRANQGAFEMGSILAKFCIVGLGCSTCL